MQKEKGERMGNSKSIRWGGLARKIVCGASTIALAASLTPAAAFAAIDSSGNANYTMPTQPIAIQKTLTDAAGNSYTQESLSVMLGTPPMQTTYCRMLGISNAGLASDRAAALQNPSSFTDTGLYGSDANEAPDEYLYNYCVSVTNPSAIIPESHAAVQMETVGRASYGKAVAVSINGEDLNMPNEVYAEVNLLVGASATSTPQAEAASSKTWGEWVELENQRDAANRPKTGTYAPSYITFGGRGGGTYGLVEAIYGMAEQADQIIAASADANGNYRYATRYAEGPTTTQVVAGAFEDISKATEYYVLSKVASGDIEKATVAVVCGFDANTNNFAVRILNPGVAGDKDDNKYGGRLASAVNPIASDMTTNESLQVAQQTYAGTASKVVSSGSFPDVDESNAATYVKWYSADTIVKNCDAVFLSDAPVANATTVPYLAADSTGKIAVAPSDDAAVAVLTAAQAAAKAAGSAKVADICAKYPQCMFTNFYAQGCENVMLNFITASYLYPSQFNLTDTMAWWAKNLWHIKDGSLQDIVDTTCYNVSLSTNQTQIGTISSNFEEKINAMIDEGNKFYLKNMDEIDAIAEGNIKAHDSDAMFARYAESFAQDVKAAEQALVDLQTKSAEEIAAAQAALTEAQAALTKAEAAQRSAEAKAAQYQVAQQAAEQKAATAEAAAAEAQAAAADAQAAAAAAEQALADQAASVTTIEVNKATVSAGDISEYATTVVIGAKAKKISAQAFKGSKVKTVIVLSSNLTKAKVKNCFKGSKVKTVYVPASKKAAYSKFLGKKAVVGKKVTIA